MSESRIREPVFNGEAAIYQAGSEHARTIVLVHGLGDAGARDFRHVIPWLARDFHVLTFDLPGFGQSSKANAHYAPAGYAAFVKHVVDRHGRRPFALVGHSLGAVVALRYATAYPQDVDRLVIVDAPGILYRYSFTNQWLAHLGAGFLPPSVSSRDMIGGLIGKVLGGIERIPFDPETILESPGLRERVLGGDPTRIAGLALALEDFSRTLGKIEAPTLLVWGADDTLAPPRTGRLLAIAMPRARLTLLPDTGHVPMLQSPGSFRAAIEEFLRDGALPPAPAWVARAAGAGTNARCDRQPDLVYEGEYDTLVIDGCANARVRRARVRELRILHSTVTIDDSEIGGGATGLHVRNAVVTITGGRIDAEVAITALGSRLDLAGVELIARRQLVLAPLASSVVFSICRSRTAAGERVLHGFRALSPRQPL